MTGTAEIYTYTVVNSSTEAFRDKTPYLVAIVTKQDGSRVSGFVEGYTSNDEIGCGTLVELAGTDALGNQIFRLRS